jgi:hypothetical protein
MLSGKLPRMRLELIERQRRAPTFKVVVEFRRNAGA